MSARNTNLVLLGLALAVVSAGSIGLMVGAFPVGLGGLAEALVHLASGLAPQTPEELVIVAIRGPRVLAGLLVSPDVLGVSAGAGLGAVVGIFLSLPVSLIHALAFAGGLVTVGLVFAIAAAVRGREPTLVLVLGGVVVGALAGAALSLLKVLADPYDQLPAITFWLLGSLASVRGGQVASMLPGVCVGLVPLILLRWRINVLALGDDEAKSLGLDVARLRTLLIAAATLMTSSVVAITGVIGWVGLVIPHIARMLVGPNFERLLPAAMLLGAAYLVMVDTLARSIARIEVPIGILTAVVGAPFFLWLLRRGREGSAS
jgi:iron complex transport system permease protein